MNISMLTKVLRLAGLLPLAIYPAVLVANAMQAAALMEAKKRGDVASFKRTLMGSFVSGTTIYPLIVLLCQTLAGKAHNEASKLAWSAAPLAFLGALAGLFLFLDKSDGAE